MDSLEKMLTGVITHVVLLMVLGAVDYMLFRSVDSTTLENFNVEIQTVNSDHNILHLETKWECTYLPTMQENATSLHKFKWNKLNCEAFVEKLKSDSVENMFEENLSQNSCTKDEVDNLVSGFTNIMQNVAEPVFGKCGIIKKMDYCTKCASWMSEECKQL